MEKTRNVESAASQAVAPASVVNSDAQAGKALEEFPPLYSVNKVLGPLALCLLTGRMRFGFFLGAGCSASIQGAGGKPLIPQVAPLTELVLTALETNHAKEKKAVLNLCQGNGRAKPNIEDILSQIRGTAAVLGDAKIGDLTKTSLEALDQEICKIVVAEVSKDLPPKPNAFDEFAHWIRAVDRPYSVEVFTPNYDLLIEQVFERHKVPYYDGFVGSGNAFFDLDGIEQDVLSSRWVRLWKVHGSINWRQDAKGAAIRVGGGDVGDTKRNRYLIFPSHLKYDESRKMPYLAMFDRLRSFLHQQMVLFVVGYSFSDQHLNEVIIEGLSSNPFAKCFALMHSKLSSYSAAIEISKQCPNLTLIAKDGACVSRKPGGWIGEERAALTGPAVQIATAADEKQKDTTVVPFCTAGDFASFSKLLLDHLPAHSIEGLRQ